MIVLALLIICCLIRVIRGPKIVDRIIAVNMIGTMTIIIIAILSVLMKESYLLDVSLIYAMISFLAVVVLSKVYLGIPIKSILENSLFHHLTFLFSIFIYCKF